ncbi:MAG: c-type cytochrome [Bacteriovoracaceae bacterium]|nr:c-type cytochrome [Bacteriovoracaceae bacterium]
MIKNFIYSVLLLTFISTPLHTNASESSITLTTYNQKKVLTLSELKKILPPIDVTLYDHVYKKQKSFVGFKLKSLLALLGEIPKNVDEIIFTSLDGYAPSISLKVLNERDAIVTFSEKDGKAFELVNQGKEKLDPGPFYLVWPDPHSKISEDVPWAYQLTSIELVSFKEKYPRIFPDKNSTPQILRGFKLYQSLCMKCHSINLEGGEIGPELNIPKNITEYWDGKILHQFIQNSSSFRLMSKMPSFVDVLNSKQVDDVIAYIRSMKDKKIMPKP